MTLVVRLIAWTLLAAGLSGLTGCATVRPRAAALDPVPVYLGDFGVHSGLFLPTPDGRFVEYQFGDWRYAAENKTGPQDAIVALAASPGAAFGRQYHPSVPGKNLPDLARKPASLQRIDCERADVYDLIYRLDKRYAALMAANGPAVKNDAGVEFVRDNTGHYSVANNCNHLTARSLKELGCDVSGWVVWSKFRVEPAPPMALPPAVAAKKASQTQIAGWTSVGE